MGANACLELESGACKGPTKVRNRKSIMIKAFQDELDIQRKGLSPPERAGVGRSRILK
jgi:hypothetical protein